MFQKLKLSEINLNNKCANKVYCFAFERKIRKIQKIHFESQILARFKKNLLYY